jgi:tetratricopeptide (TPR) repeat protein
MATVLVLSTLISCAAPPAASLTPIASPDLERLEPIARETLEAAARSLDQAIAHGLPDHELAERFGDLGRLYLAHALRDPAAICFQNAGLLDADAGEWPHLAGVAHQEAGRLEDAARAFDRALAIEPSNMPARLRRGRVRLDAGRAREAAEDFRTVLAQTAPTDSAPAVVGSATSRARGAAYYGLGLALRALETLDEAIRAFESARALAPDANAIHYALGLAYRDRGEADRARQHLARAGTRRPVFGDTRVDSLGSLLTGARVHIALGGQARRLGRRAQALQLFRKAVTLEPENARAHHNVGAMLAEEGNLAEALPHLQRAASLDPAATDARFDLASARAQAGQLEASLIAFHAVLARAPNDLEARRRRASVAQVLDRSSARRDAQDNGP